MLECSIKLQLAWTPYPPEHYIFIDEKGIEEEGRYLRREESSTRHSIHHTLRRTRLRSRYTFHVGLYFYRAYIIDDYQRLYGLYTVVGRKRETLNSFFV